MIKPGIDEMQWMRDQCGVMLLSRPGCVFFLDRLSRAKEYGLHCLLTACHSL